VTKSLNHRLDSKVNESMTNPNMTYFGKVGYRVEPVTESVVAV